MLELASIHMPKAAGTAFRHLLERWYGDELALDYTRDGVVSGDKRAVHGHFPADLYQATHTITWVREPAARLVSQYYFWRSTPWDWVVEEEHRTMKADQTPLLEFAELESSREIMSREFTCGWPVDRFLFVGVFEWSGPEVSRLARLLGKPSMTMPRVNMTTLLAPEYAEFVASPGYAAALDHIRALNPGDCELYDEAKDRAKSYWDTLSATG